MTAEPGLGVDPTDPNTELGPFVEGLILGALDMDDLEEALNAIKWSVELEHLDRYALVFTSPSGIRWRLIAKRISGPSTTPGTLPGDDGKPKGVRDGDSGTQGPG